MQDGKTVIKQRNVGGIQPPLTKEELMSNFRDSPRNRTKSKMKRTVLGEVSVAACRYSPLVSFSILLKTLLIRLTRHWSLDMRVVQSADDCGREESEKMMGKLQILVSESSNLSPVTQRQHVTAVIFPSEVTTHCIIEICILLLLFFTTIIIIIIIIIFTLGIKDSEGFGKN